MNIINYYDLKKVETNNYYKNNIIKKELLKDLKILKINYRLILKYEKIINENKNKKGFNYFKYYYKIDNKNNTYDILKIIFKYKIDHINNINEYNIRNSLLNYYTLIENYKNVIMLLSEKINYINNLN